MHRFEYEIKLNDKNRPYISIPDDYIDKPEDKFMSLELSCYILQRLLTTRKDDLDENTIKTLEISLNTISKISDEVAILIKEQMELMGDVTMQFKNNYHFQVSSIQERNAINYNGIIRGDKIFKRIEGLRVLVTSENKIYELRGGIDNENWIEI